MKKIKFIGIVIFMLTITLIYISVYISEQNKTHTMILESIHNQKALIQSIAKNSFYLYREKSKNLLEDIPTKRLDKSIEQFYIIANNENKLLKTIKSTNIIQQNNLIYKLWNNFHKDILTFEQQIEVTIPYTNILLEKTVSRIFNQNLYLITQFDKLIQLQKQYFAQLVLKYKQLEYILLFLIVLCVLYLLTQINTVISFVQQFLQTSNKVIENKSIEDIQPIKINQNNSEIQQATNNFNAMVSKINTSIQIASNSIEDTSKSLENIENNIEEFLILLNTMDKDHKIDIEITKKEDAVIQALDELMSITDKLDNLKHNLHNLIQSK